MLFLPWAGVAALDVDEDDLQTVLMRLPIDRVQLSGHDLSQVLKAGAK